MNWKGSKPTKVWNNLIYEKANPKKKGCRISSALLKDGYYVTTDITSNRR